MFAQRPQSTFPSFALVTASRQQKYSNTGGQASTEPALNAADAVPALNGKKHKGEKNESDEIFFAKESFVGTRLIVS
jgi:hypothetical protein